MSVIKTTVAGIVMTPGGSPAKGVLVRALLTVPDVDVETRFVAPALTKATTDGSGQVTMDLWPNSRGESDSRYLLEIGPFAKFIVEIPEAEEVVSLADVIAAAEEVTQ